jgi:hypothetical protein
MAQPTGVNSAENVQFLMTAANFVMQSLKRRESICGRDVSLLMDSDDLEKLQGANQNVGQLMLELEQLFAAKKRFSKELKEEKTKLQDLAQGLATKITGMMTLGEVSTGATVDDSETDELEEGGTPAKLDEVATKALGTKLDGAPVAEAAKVGSDAVSGGAVSTTTDLSESCSVLNESICKSGTPRLVFYCDGLKEGDALFMRGDGPDMSWEKGIPCQHHEEGHYYVDLLQGAPEHFTFKLLINDAVWSQGENFTFSKKAYDEENAFAFSPVFDCAV